MTAGLNIQREQEKSFLLAVQALLWWAVPGGFLHPALLTAALPLPEQPALPGEVLLCSSGVTEGKGEVVVVCANSEALLRTGVALFLWHCWDFSSEMCLMGTGHREVCSSAGVGILGACPAWV